MMRMQSYPLDSERGPMKSRAISRNQFEWTGRGCKNPVGACIEDLFWTQQPHDHTCASTSLVIPGQRKLRLRLPYVLEPPK